MENLFYKTDTDSCEIFKWNKNFEIGISYIDAQHQELVNLVNCIFKDLLSDCYNLKSNFAAFFDYTQTHFKDEEKIWESYFGENNLVISHKKAHKSFIEKINSLQNELSKNTEFEVVEKIIAFTLKWIVSHIFNNDKRMAFAVEAIKAGKSIEQAKLISNKKMGASIHIITDALMSTNLNIFNLIKERKLKIEALNNLEKTNRELDQMAKTDQLTGLYNRRSFEKIFQAELQRGKRREDSVTFMMIDIDYFKSYNDNYGHLEGDNALKKITAAISTCCKRAGDFAFRLGGEEFGVLSSNLEKEKAYQLGKIIQHSIDNIKLKHSFSKVSDYMTISIGIHNSKVMDGITMDYFIKKADENLYKAKNLGRNQIVST